MKRFCFAVDLVDNHELIAEYEQWHRTENGWPEIRKSILDAGIIDMEIYRTGNRLTMVMETTDNYLPEKKSAMDAADPKVVEWEKLMDRFQQPLPWAKAGGKWTLMDRIFKLTE